MKNQSLHVIKEMCAVSKRISQDLCIFNHLVDELIQQVQIDCNEQDLNNEIKETLITGGGNG
jgi:hypothetical protein